MDDGDHAYNDSSHEYKDLSHRVGNDDHEIVEADTAIFWVGAPRLTIHLAQVGGQPAE